MLQGFLKKKKKTLSKTSPDVAACELSYTVFIKLGVLLMGEHLPTRGEAPGSSSSTEGKRSQYCPSIYIYKCTERSES